MESKADGTMDNSCCVEVLCGMGRGGKKVFKRHATSFEAWGCARSLGGSIYGHRDKMLNFKIDSPPYSSHAKSHMDLETAYALRKRLTLYWERALIWRRVSMQDYIYDLRTGYGAPSEA